MGDKWKMMLCEDAVAINPQRVISRGTIAPHISMDTLQPFTREISGFEMKKFKGSGSRFQNGDTLLARITPCLENGKTAFVSCLADDAVGHGSTEFIVLSGKKGISDNLFVYYLVKEPEFRNYAIQQMEGSTGRQRVPAKAIAKLKLNLPPLSEQKAIASILGALDDKIELNRKMNETLEAMARAIFKSWFVDFAPIPGLGPPKEWQDSPLGKIPKGWRVGKVDDLGQVICGKTPPTADPENYGYEMPFITIPDMHGQVFVIISEKKLSKKGINTQPTKTLPALSVCVSCIATPGLVVLTIEPSQTNQQINSVIHCDGISPYYCYMTLSELAHEIRARGSGGSVTLNLNKTQFAALPVLIPDAMSIEALHKALTPIFDKILLNAKQSLTLATTRDALLPKLLSGEIRVKDAVRFVDERL